MNAKLTNYLSPKDNFHSLPISFPGTPTKVDTTSGHTLMEEVANLPLPTKNPKCSESFVGIQDLKNDTYVELTNYKINYPGQGSLVDLQKILEQLRLADIPVDRPSGLSIYENFGEYTEESIFFDANGMVSRFYIGALSVVGLLILYRMLKL
jgi:hypothetical protein